MVAPETGVLGNDQAALISTPYHRGFDTPVRLGTPPPNSSACCSVGGFGRVGGMSATLHCNGWEIITCPSVSGWIAIGTRNDRDSIVAIEATEGDALLEIQRQIRIIAG